MNIKWKIIQRSSFLIVIMILSIYAVARVFFNYPIIFDDSFITNIYARHLADFGAFFYNDINKPIDGFTSLLDVIIKGLLYKFIFHDIVKAGMLATLIYQLLLLFSLTFFIVKQTFYSDDKNENHNNIFTVIIFSVCILSIYVNEIISDATISYLETPLFMLIGLWAVYLLPLKKKKKTNHILFFLSMILLVFTRPEGILIAGILLIFYIINIKSYYNNNLIEIRYNIILVAAFFIIIALYYMWRITTFGYWAPNTYYAKTSALRINEILDGFNYISNFFKTNISNIFKFLFILSMPFFAAVFSWKNNEDRNRYIIICIVIFASIAGTIYSGGDCYIQSGRIIALPLILSLLGAFYIIRNVNKIFKIAVTAIILFIMITELVYSPQTSVFKPISSMMKITDIFNQDTNWSLNVSDYEGRSIKILNEKYPLIKVAQSDFQRIKLYADDIEVIDLSGLNDRDIAHIKLKSQVLWGKYSHNLGIDANAEIWIIGYKYIGPKTWTDYDISEIFSDMKIFSYFIGDNSYIIPDDLSGIIKKNYYLADIPLKINKNGQIELYLNFLIRKDFADKIGNDKIINIARDEEK